MSMQTRQEMLKKKIQVQNMIILALAIVIIVLIIVSSTAAWYIRTKSDSADIVLSNPVNIYITEYDSKVSNGVEYFEHEVVQDILEGYNNRIYPGDRIKLNLGMQIGSEDLPSSPAYVRVKLNMAFSKLADNPDGSVIPLEKMADDGLIEFEDKPDERDWLLVDFNNPTGGEVEEGHVTDYWYVLKVTSNGKTSARVVEDMETLEFLNGYVKLSKTNITNKHANHKFHITYTVEAIQMVNVPDPIVNRGEGPWWAMENTDDIYKDQA